MVFTMLRTRCRDHAPNVTMLQCILKPDRNFEVWKMTRNFIGRARRRRGRIVFGCLQALSRRAFVCVRSWKRWRILWNVGSRPRARWSGGAHSRNRCRLSVDPIPLYAFGGSSAPSPGRRYHYPLAAAFVWRFYSMFHRRKRVGTRRPGAAAGISGSAGRSRHGKCQCNRRPA